MAVNLYQLNLHHMHNKIEIYTLDLIEQSPYKNFAYQLVPIASVNKL